MTVGPVHAVVLAGQRSVKTPLGEAANVAADVMVSVAGRPALLRVLDALSASQQVRPSVLVGPNRSILEESTELRALIHEHGLAWCEPKDDPVTSSIAGIEGLGTPLLLTTGDHALLTPATVDEFCGEARESDADLVVGLVSHKLVRDAFPGNRRTVLRFADGHCCGANLFWLNRPRGIRALEFWRDIQQHRKRPQRIARELGVGFLWRYLFGRLVLSRALEDLSSRTGCRLGAVKLNDAKAAVDVDSIADWQLAERILTGD